MDTKNIPKSLENPDGVSLATAPGSTGPYLSAVAVVSPPGKVKPGYAEYLRGVFRKRIVVYDPPPGTEIDRSELLLCNTGDEKKMVLPEGTLVVTLDEALSFL